MQSLTLLHEQRRILPSVSQNTASESATVATVVSPAERGASFYAGYVERPC